MLRARRAAACWPCLPLIGPCGKRHRRCAHKELKPGGRSSCRASAVAPPLLREFASSGRGILLGTASFWEGNRCSRPAPARPRHPEAPVPGSPTRPVTQARMEAMKKVGQNPFHGFMLPDAALRLKQGVGRTDPLARRPRRSRAVGRPRLASLLRRFILDTLPPMPLAKGPWQKVRRSIAGVLRGRVG